MQHVIFLVSTYRGEIKHDTGEMLKFSVLDYPGNVSEIKYILIIISPVVTKTRGRGLVSRYSVGIRTKITSAH